MRITEIRAHNLELTEAIKGYVEKKLDSLQKFCHGYSPCDATVEVAKTTNGQQKGKIWKARVDVVVPGGHLHAESIMEDLYAAIDRAKDELKRELVKHKEKVGV